MKRMIKQLVILCISLAFTGTVECQEVLGKGLPKHMLDNQNREFCYYDNDIHHESSFTWIRVYITKDGKHPSGVMVDNKLIIPCNYGGIEYDKQLNLFLCQGTYYNKCAAYSSKGEVVFITEGTHMEYKHLDREDEGYFDVSDEKKGYGHGAFSITGKELIPTLRDRQLERKKSKIDNKYFFKVYDHSPRGLLYSFTNDKGNIIAGPFDYCTIYEGVSGTYFIAESDDYAALFNFNGEEVIPFSMRIKRISNPEIATISEKEYFKVSDVSNNYGIMDVDGRIIVPIEFKLIMYENYGVFKVYNYNSEKGLYDYNGKELLTPEFKDCSCLNDNLIEFKMNDYWGVMNREGKVIIPLSRQYTKIDYSRTLKTFTFEKEGGYKGECNAKGIQTSISKPMETVASNTKTTKTSSSTSNSKGTNGTSSSTSKATSNNNEPGLLYRGEYTISEDVGSTIEIISIYEDRIVVGGSFSFDYKSTNSKGNRVYSGNGPFGVYWRFYVSPNYNIRLTKDYPNPFGGTSTAVNCRVTKGQSSMPVQNGGGYYGGTGGYDTNFGGNTGGNSGGNTNTQTKTHKCGLCNGTGRVIETNGTSFGNTKYCSECGKTVPDSHYHTTCPSCKGKGYW